MSAGAAISAAPGTTAAEVAAEGLLIGAPMALTLMAWGKTLGANPPRLAATEIFAATGIAAACCFALWFAPEEIGLALRCVLPFAGVAFMEIARHEQSSATSETMHPTPIKPARARTLSARMLAGALIFGLAAGFVETYRSDPARFPRPHSPMPCSSWALFCGGVLKRCAPQVSAIHSRRATASRSRSCSPAFCSRPCSWMSISRATPLYRRLPGPVCSFRIAVLRERPARRNKLRARLRTRVCRALRRRSTRHYPRKRPRRYEFAEHHTLCRHGHRGPRHGVRLRVSVHRARFQCAFPCC